MITGLFLILQSSIIVVLIVMQATERKDLYNRIMSKDYREYIKLPEDTDERPLSGHRKVIKHWRREE